ncbi:CheR family methyltransferase [Alkanindiges sp. WGS2144]|uniref:CheR family methyltransferase n=1 Tax=Alkanindiges sp. WGS2144 TaxID=3366808 RepID=UPI003751B1B7
MDELTHNGLQSLISAEMASLWRSLIESRMGMVLPARQHQLFEQRIVKNMSQYQLDADSYYQLVCQDRSEWQRLAESLVVHETSFFRHPPSFNLVEQYLMQATQPVKLWSVGCSTGEEAWSLAMLADRFAMYGYEVLATDISQQVLVTAKEGIYLTRKTEQIPARFRGDSGQAVGQHYWQIAPHLRPYVFFRQFNLMNVVTLPFRRLNIIFCQNVLIYFKKFDRRDILNALVKCLDVGGVLVLGPGEILEWRHHQLKKIDWSGTLAYEKICT